MKRAVELARHSEAEPGRSEPPPKVGVVIAKNGVPLGESYRGEERPGEHAEFRVLERLTGVDLSGAEVFTTLEPCTSRNPPKVPCAQRLVDREVGTVYIGAYDPNPSIYRQGWRLLRDAGVTLRDFPVDLREEIAADNRDFVEAFRIAAGDVGQFRFDWTENDGRFEVKTSGGEFVTAWSTNGANSIHAYAKGNERIALARFARSFDEIDDPGAFQFENHSVRADAGDIVIFKNSRDAHLLVRILEVHAGPHWGSEHVELRAEYKLRPTVR